MADEPNGIVDAAGRAAAGAIVDILRGSLRELLDRPRTEPGPGPPRKPASRFLSRAPVPLPLTAAVPPPAPAESQPPAPAESNSKPASQKEGSLDFVGFISEKPDRGLP